jgi:hypothetical protein
MITPKVSLLEPATRDRLADLQRYFTIMGYADAFALIGIVLLVAVLAVTMLRKGAAAGGAAH